MKVRNTFEVVDKLPEKGLSSNPILYTEILKLYLYVLLDNVIHSVIMPSNRNKSVIVAKWVQSMHTPTPTNKLTSPNIMRCVI